MAAVEKKGGGAGVLRGKETIRCLAVAFKEKMQRPGTTEAMTSSATAAAGDSLEWVPAEQALYWTHKEQTSVVPLVNCKYLKLDL